MCVEMNSTSYKDRLVPWHDSSEVEKDCPMEPAKYIAELKHEWKELKGKYEDAEKKGLLFEPGEIDRDMQRLKELKDLRSKFEPKVYEVVSMVGNIRTYQRDVIPQNAELPRLRAHVSLWLKTMCGSNVVLLLDGEIVTNHLPETSFEALSVPGTHLKRPHRVPISFIGTARLQAIHDESKVLPEDLGQWRLRRWLDELEPAIRSEEYFSISRICQAVRPEDRESVRQRLVLLMYDMRTSRWSPPLGRDEQAVALLLIQDEIDNFDEKMRAPVVEKDDRSSQRAAAA